MRAVMMLGLIGVSACAPSEEAFPEAAARASCDRVARCDANRFTNVWDDDRAACIDDQTEGIEEVLGLLGLAEGLLDCAYDASAATEALAAYNGPCGADQQSEINTALGEVYRCSL